MTGTNTAQVPKYISRCIYIYS